MRIFNVTLSSDYDHIAKLKTATALGTYTSMATFKSDLLAIAETLATQEAKLIQFVFTTAVSPFDVWSTHAGWMHCIQHGPSSLYFTCNVASNNADHVIIAYSNGTWAIKKTTSS